MGECDTCATQQRQGGASRARRQLATALGVALLSVPTAALTASPAQAAGIHKGNYTCYQAGQWYWGYLKIKAGNKYVIANGKGRFELKKKGKKLVFKSGSLKKWGWVGRYSTGVSGGGEKEWQIDLVDRKAGTKVNCYD